MADHILGVDGPSVTIPTGVAPSNGFVTAAMSCSAGGVDLSVAETNIGGFAADDIYGTGISIDGDGNINLVPGIYVADMELNLGLAGTATFARGTVSPHSFGFNDAIVGTPWIPRGNMNTGPFPWISNGSFWFLQIAGGTILVQAGLAGETSTTRLSFCGLDIALVAALPSGT